MHNLISQQDEELFQMTLRDKKPKNIQKGLIINISEIPICPYCGSSSILVDSKVIYGISYGLAWICIRYPECDSYVTCHPGTPIPLGSLANAELRELRKQAHRFFDGQWKSKKQSRKKAYNILFKKTGIKHIGNSTKEQCEQILLEYKK